MTSLGQFLLNSDTMKNSGKRNRPFQKGRFLRVAQKTVSLMANKQYWSCILTDNKNSRQQKPTTVFILLYNSTISSERYRR